MNTEIKSREQLINYFINNRKLHVKKYNNADARLKVLCARLYSEGKLTRINCPNTYLYIYKG